MTRDELITKVSESSGVTKNTVSNVVKTLFMEMEQAFAQGEDVSIKNFGRFDVTTTKEHEGRNPQTGEPIIIPEKKRIRFTTGEPLRRVINNY